MGRVKMSKTEWQEIVEDVRKMEEIVAAVRDLFGHHLHEPAVLKVEPEPSMHYGVHLVLDGGYRDHEIAQKVAADIWAKRHRTLMERLAQYDRHS